MGLENPMIITHLERATQLYQALQDYQQSTHAFPAVIAAHCYLVTMPQAQVLAIYLKFT